MKIDSFPRPDTCREARRELEKQLKPTLNGLLLDLGDNAGGLIAQAFRAADVSLGRPAKLGGAHRRFALRGAVATYLASAH